MQQHGGTSFPPQRCAGQVGSLSGQGAALAAADCAAWRRAGGIYLAVSAIGHLAWEFAQQPFYAVWRTGSATEIGFDALHCTAGDILIAASTAGLAFLLVRAWTAPLGRFHAAMLTLLLGLSYTAFSEWLNVEVRKSWAYADLMPLVPPLGTGLLPLLQWLAVPLAALFATRHALRKERINDARLDRMGRSLGRDDVGDGPVVDAHSDPGGARHRRARQISVLR
jgi:hypothetical protein